MESVTALSDLFPQTQTAKTTKNNVDELGQRDFLKLMVAQLENQDPSKPMDNFEFLSQIAQFGTVSGIQDLQKGVSDLSSALFSGQALQAASLVGREVITNSNIGSLAEGGVLNATVDVPQAAPAVAMYVQDTSGRLVYTETLGAATAGPLAWQWQGLDVNGDSLPAGQYRISAEILTGTGSQAVTVGTHHQVSSVSIENGGTKAMLNLADGSKVSLAQVKSIL